MADLIECRDCDSPHCDGCNIYTLAMMLHRGELDCLMDEHYSIVKAPTVDAVEVVRCGECKHMRIEFGYVRWCTVWDVPQGMGDDGFCNYGERRG